MEIQEHMEIEAIGERVGQFREVLQRTKAELSRQLSFPWYPYDSMGNFGQLERLLSGPNRRLLDLADGRPIADIGGADGDVAFFLETLGQEVDFVDYPPTNMNGLRGVKALKQALGSSIAIHETDLDSQFRLPRSSYGLVIFLGILYHLKNPYYVLEALARSTRYCLISTRIARFTPDHATRLADAPVAYLLDCLECNKDSSNYWIFSEAGLRRILSRTGWQVCDFMTAGDTVDSDPAAASHDERAYCLVKSTVDPKAARS